MARGKYRAAHAARERAAVAELAAQLAEEVAGEQTRVRGADDRARQRRLADDRLATERAQLTEQLADQTRQLRQVADDLTGLIRELETSGDQVVAGWRRCEEKLAHRLGGEAAVRSLLRGLPTIVLPEGGHRTPNAVARARAAARGQRLAGDVDLAYAPMTWYAPWLPEPLRTIGLEMRQYAPLGVRGIRTGWVAERVRDVPEELKDAVRHVAGDLETVSASTVDDPHPLALVAWHTPPWLAPGELDDPDTHRIAPALGLDIDDIEAELEPSPANEEQEGYPPAAGQDRQKWKDWQEGWRRDLGRVARTGRLTTPWAPRPVFPRPSDALALRHWYRAVAAASWRHSGQTLALVSNAVESDWKQATLPAARRSARTWEGVGTAFTDAAMYWLPSGHTAAHADSEPLDSDAALDLRLPYDAVFLAFADPILLPPIDNNPGGEHYQRIRRSAAARPGPGTDPRSLTWRTVMEDNVTSAVEAESRKTTFAAVPSLVRYHGAVAEGLLLLAEPDGRPVDRFAWCLALTDPETGEILGRDIVIANRSLTAYRTLIDNMLAVVAWADWHHDLKTVRPTGPPAGHDAAWEDAAGITPGLHVLDTTGSPHASRRNPQQDTGRQLRPHRRRGYWRRQHHGPGNRNIKWIRIPPTIVNAHRGPLGWQVYQLPPAV